MTKATSDAVLDDRASESRAGILTLLRAIFVKRYLLMVRYRVNFAAQFLGMYLFFAVIFFGGKAAVDRTGAGAMTSTFDGIIIGWFLLMMAQAAYFSLASNVTQESQWGTLEQLYMSPYGFGKVMFLKVTANVTQGMIIGLAILAMMLLTTQRELTVDLLTVLPVVLLALLSIVGIGFVFAGLTLIYKRIESVSKLMQFVLVGLIAAPVTDISPLRYLPVVQGSSMLQTAMRDGVRLWEFPLHDVGVLAVVAVGYLAAGYAVFRYCTHVARKRGVMGHY